MDFTKNYCCIEKRANDFSICRTKDVYFKDGNGFHPISTSNGQISTFYIMDNAKKPRAIKSVISSDDDKDVLAKKISSKHRVKFMKSLSITEKPESQHEKKVRVNKIEKKSVNSKKKKITHAAKRVIEDGDSQFLKFVQNQQVVGDSESLLSDNIDDFSTYDASNDMFEDDLENSSEERLLNNSNIYQVVADVHLPVLNNELIRINTSSTIEDYPDRFDDTKSVNSSDPDLEDHQQSNINLDNLDAIIPETEPSDDERNSGSQNIDRNDNAEEIYQSSATVRQQPVVGRFFENLWPEANSSSSNGRETYVTIGELKTCLKEFGGELVKTVANMKDSRSTSEEFELPPVQNNNKIVICEKELDAGEVFKAKDVPSLRKCVNHITRAYWSLDERKKLVLSSRQGQVDKRTIKNDDVHKIKKISLLIQKGRKFDKKLKCNQIENARQWIKDALKNDRRPSIPPEKKALYAQRSRERRKEKKEEQKGRNQDNRNTS